MRARFSAKYLSNLSTTFGRCLPREGALSPTALKKRSERAEGRGVYFLLFREIGVSGASEAASGPFGGHSASAASAARSRRVMTPLRLSPAGP